MATPPTQGVSTEPPSFDTSSATQKVWREGIEVFKLREQLARANSDQSRFDLLGDLIDNLLPLALAIPEPPAGEPGALEYPDRRRRIEEIDHAMMDASTDAPVPETPFVRPSAADYPRVIYSIQLRADTPASLVMREEVMPMMDKLMENEQRRAAHKAVRLLRGYYREIREFLAMFPDAEGKRWDLGTAYSTEVTAFSQDRLDRNADHFRRMENEGRASGRPSDDGEDEEDEDEDDGYASP